MRYIRSFENNDNRFIWFIINVASEEAWKKSLDKIENILKAKLEINLNIRKIKEMFKQPYLCVSVEKLDSINLLGYMPLIDARKKDNIIYGIKWFRNHKQYKFGGYINCTEEEVNNYIEIFDNINKYNV